MWGRNVAAGLLALTVCGLSASCATSKIVVQNVSNVANGKPVDQTGLSQALASDTKEIETGLAQLRRRFAEALVQLRSNVQKRWGQNDTKTAERTVYVKYTQDYKTRVVTDFDHGSLTIETVDDRNPQASLRTAIIAALLTSNDPSSVDLFSDKDVELDASRKPYLFGLVRDDHGKSIRTRAQAEQFATYLMAHKAESRPVSSEQGAKSALFVKLAMVRNFEAKGAERYRASIDRYSAQYHVSPTLVLAVMRTESNFNPFAVSSAPAYGLMQLVPTSAGRAAVKRVQGVDQTPTPEYLFDPEHNIELGAAYLGLLDATEFQSVSNQESRDYCVIAAYNAGARSVVRTFSASKTEAIKGINVLDSATLYERLRTQMPSEETRQYLVKVARYRREFALAPASAPSG